ncbi:MAG: hypothetical protein ACXVYB_08805 [Arthrobacter sp.]
MADTVTSLAETFKNVGVARAYGAPVTVGGEELIPVALVSFGFGGGSDAGAGDGAGAKGAAGGGGGGFVLPVGVYSRNGSGRMVFKPNTIAVLAALVPLACAVGMSLRGVLRAARK